MEIIFDGKKYNVDSNAKNLVKAMDIHGVSIFAPCFRNGSKHGCCMACLIEVNGREGYACATKPIDGMKVAYGRSDLVEKRKKLADEYVVSIKNGVEGSYCGTYNYGISSASSASSAEYP